jgi:hypothetical protein
VEELPRDEELLRRLRAGDEAAFVLVLDRWSPGMVRLARSFVSTPDSAAECCGWSHSPCRPPRTGAVLHDAVPSAIRSGVASGVSSLSWLAFLPVALGFGALSTAHGVRSAGWLLVAASVLAGLLLVATARASHPVVEPVGTGSDLLAEPVAA